MKNFTEYMNEGLKARRKNSGRQTPERKVEKANEHFWDMTIAELKKVGAKATKVYLDDMAGPKADKAFAEIIDSGTVIYFHTEDKK
jgi:hypothetical protein